MRRPGRPPPGDRESLLREPICRWMQKWILIVGRWLDVGAEASALAQQLLASLVPVQLFPDWLQAVATSRRSRP